MSDIIPNEEVATFLEKLKAADAGDLLFAPGIGLYRADEILRGLKTHALQIHWTGRGLAMTVEEGVAGGKRTVVPTPALLNWEAWLAARAFHDPPVKAAAVKALVAGLRAVDFEVHERAKAEPLLAGAADPWSLT